MNGPARRALLCAALTVAAVLVGACSRSGEVPHVAAVVEGTKIPAAQTQALLEGHMKNELAQADSDGHEFDRDRKRTLTHFVLLYQIKHALLRHLATGMDISVESGANLSPDAEAGRLSYAMAKRLFPDVAAPAGEPADKAAASVDQQRQSLFSDWFDKRLRRADVRVDRHFGRWDGGRGVVQ